MRASVAALVAFVVVACGGGSDSSGPTACDSSKCLPGNTCIATQADRAVGTSQCRFPCATHADCPSGYHCDANAGGTSPYCVADAIQVPAANGQWAAPCPPSGGIAKNAACDVADGFACWGSSPTDANAFCTRYACKTDDDCGHGWWCARLNQFPNLEDPKVMTGATWNVCMPRTYCSPCASDIDCSPVNGVPQHCLAANDGTQYCAPECTSDPQCALDAHCVPQRNYAACVPRAGVCVGDGSLCAPCRSDADCKGTCVGAYQSPERFCAVKSGAPCVLQKDGSITAQCPSSTPATPRVSCSVSQYEPDMPPDLCIGEVVFGTDNGQPIYETGCWTVH